MLGLVILSEGRVGGYFRERDLSAHAHGRQA